LSTRYFVDHAHLGVSSRPQCYLEAIRAKVLELVEKEKEKTGDRVQGEPNLSGKIVQGDINAEGLSLDSVMADFIHMDAAVDANATETDAMATVEGGGQ
jgi:PHO85 cyclin-5